MGSMPTPTPEGVPVLMTSPGRAGKPLHPTNLHVNRELFPNDTVQSRMPEPGWLERWLDGQIQFDAGQRITFFGNDNGIQIRTAVA